MLFFVFGRRSAYKNPHPYPVQRIFCLMGMRRICNVEDGWSDRWRLTVYSSSLTSNLCFKAGWVILSSSKTSNQGTGTGCRGSNLQDGWPVRRFSTYKVSGTPLRNDWRETLFDSQDIISGRRWTYLCRIVL